MDLPRNDHVDLYPIERSGQVLAWFYIAIPVGSALGYMLGGQVLHLGFTWHYAFFIVVPPGLLLGLWAIFMRDPRHGGGGNKNPSQAHVERTAAAKLSDYKQLWHIPSYVYNTLGMTAMTFATGGLAFWIPRYLVWRKVHAGLLDPANTELSSR